MGHQFKPGDLALMLPNGRAVQIIEGLGSPDVLIWDGRRWGNPKKEPIWVVEFLSEPMADKFGVLQTRGPLCASRLMPLKGDEQPALIRQAERVQ